MNKLLSNSIFPLCRDHNINMIPSPGYPFEFLCTNCIKDLGDDVSDFFNACRGGFLSRYNEEESNKDSWNLNQTFLPF